MVKLRHNGFRLNTAQDLYGYGRANCGREFWKGLQGTQCSTTTWVVSGPGAERCPARGASSACVCVSGDLGAKQLCGQAFRALVEGAACVGIWSHLTGELCVMLERWILTKVQNISKESFDSSCEREGWEVITHKHTHTHTHREMWEASIINSPCTLSGSCRSCVPSLYQPSPVTCYPFMIPAA